MSSLLRVKLVKCSCLGTAATCLQQLPSFLWLNLVYSKTMQPWDTQNKGNVESILWNSRSRSETKMSYEKCQTLSHSFWIMVKTGLTALGQTGLFNSGIRRGKEKKILILIDLCSLLPSVYLQWHLLLYSLLTVSLTLGCWGWTGTPDTLDCQLLWFSLLI